MLFLLAMEKLILKGEDRMIRQSEEIVTYFNEEIADCQRKRQELLRDDRADEATFERIKENVFDIFKTIFAVAIKTAGEDNTEEIKQFFLNKLEVIPSGWKDSYNKAKQYGDIEKQQCEHMKLLTVEKIQANFEQIWEE